MPTYDYRCPDNGLVVEVRHGMAEKLRTWGELCEKTGMELNGTPADAPVEKMLSGSNVVNSNSLGSGAAPACNTGPCCGGGMCGLD